MALKRKITKAEFDALNPLLQAEYKAEGSDFVLDAQGFDDPGELRRALDRERQEKAAAKTEAEGLRTKLATITDVDARRTGDIATLEKSWGEKVDKIKKEHKDEIAQRDKFIQQTLVDSVALNIATELGGDNATLLLPHIKTRLAADTTGDTPLTRVLDKDGKPSAFNVEDLKKEIANDKRFSAVVIASKASGGGAAGGRPNGGGASNGQKKFQEMNDKERTEFYQRDPQGFREAAAQANKPSYAQQ
jgi:hypothetical protein